jgi:hypothetical protein
MIFLLSLKQKNAYPPPIGTPVVDHFIIRAVVHNKNLCAGVKKIVTSLSKKGDWLSSVKDAPVKSTYMSATTYKSKINFKEARENVVVVWRKATQVKKGDLYFTATFGQAKSFDSLRTLYDELAKSLKACYPKAVIEEEFTDRYAQGDGYLKMTIGEIKISLDMYANSNVNEDVVILLSISTR